MNAAVLKQGGAPASVGEWREHVQALSATFAARITQLDERDEFVAENYADLKAGSLIAAGVPEELGGLGLELAELCDMLRTLAHGCSSTALAFSMHTHQVAVNAWRWRHQKAPVAPMLERVARDRIVLVSTGGGDWLESSGEAVPAEGGFRVNGRKAFSSGSPAGDVLSTSAVIGDEVIHFAVPMSAKGLRVEPTWRTMGMRATASHDLILEDVFVPDAAVAMRRPRGKWHPLFHLLTMIALPLVYSVYLGVAEAARERALALVRRRRSDGHLLQLVGELENRLAAARVAHRAWVALGETAQPGPQTTAEALTYRTLTGEAILDAVSAAMDVAGGAAFFRANGLERLFRDAQGARYHPLQEGLQKDFTARIALGVEV
ncbi:MAG TPA: acyl-CoA dehydrogenase family protein [Burkholderiales bacterium]|jgi:alkylation response protein AidB-like acyl-CoA dehydrogenase|nr:acyl-CoA dehydrogenase family protein [Burkholderiales bacterium]